MSEGSSLPEPEYIGDVGEFIGSKTADQVINELNNKFRRFKLEEARLLQRRIYNMNKLPEIEQTLEIVNMLSEKQNSQERVQVEFELSESVYARADFETCDRVNLWLGAGIMVEYPIEEAKEVLQNSLSKCKMNLEETKKELDLAKDRVTMTEVSIARVYNHDVRQKLKERLEAKAEAEAS